MTTFVWVGIDPGATGAMAAIYGDGFIEIQDFTDPVGVRRCLHRLNDLHGDVKAAIESVHSMPREGVSSAFKFGVNVGVWKGMLAMAGIPYDEVTPQKWQKEIFDSTLKKGMDRKALSLERARRLFPSMEGFLARKKDHGRSDALLIAEWLHRKYP